MCLLPGGGFLEAFLVLLEASWEAPQVPLGGLWALLGPSGLLQWLSWALLGPPGPLLGALEAFLAILGAVLGPSWRFLGCSWAHLGRPGASGKHFWTSF